MSENIHFPMAVLLLSLPLVTGHGRADTLRDPTRPVHVLQETGDPSNHAGQLTLSAIWHSGSSRYATIDGTTARQGETIFDDITITSIHEHSVTIRRNGQEQRLELLRQGKIRR